MVWVCISLWLVKLSAFSYTCCWFVPLLLKNVYLGPLPILIGFFLCYWVVGLPYIFWKLTPCEIYGLQVLSPMLQTAFSLYWLFPSLCRSLLVWYTPTCLILLLLPVLLLSYPLNHCKGQCHGAFFLFSSRSFTSHLTDYSMWVSFLCMA